MATRLQKKLAKEIINDLGNAHPLNGGELLEKVGYSKNLQKQPGRVIDTPGVKEALADYGFTEDKAKQVVGKIMNNEKIEPNARLKAADMAFKVNGTYAPVKSVELNLNVSPTDPKVKALMEEYELKLKESI